jgi:hypothetical protein
MRSVAADAAPWPNVPEPGFVEPGRPNPPLDLRVRAEYLGEFFREHLVERLLAEKASAFSNPSSSHCQPVNLLKKLFAV